MSEGSGKLRVAAIGDLHVHENSTDALQGLFEKISQTADVVALCGDLTHLGLPVEAEKLANDLRSCRLPVVAVLGNHDYQSGHADEVKKILHAAKVTILDECETFTLKGVGFAGVKGFGGGFDKHMLTPFGEEAIKHYVAEAVNESLKLEVALKALDTERVVVILHYSPIPATVAGEPPEIFPFLGSSRLAEAIDHYDVNVVFHGHAHRGTYEGKTIKGIPVYNCCMQVMSKISPEQPYALIEV
ncbi:MAG TPA: metallophosphoesterase [Terriglobia bacterium]|nr:metallophosphoesterase [Terriglobia bacterium]